MPECFGSSIFNVIYCLYYYGG